MSEARASLFSFSVYKSPGLAFGPIDGLLSE